MTVDLSWLVGRRLKSVEKKDFSWFFILDDSSTVSTESHWRLIQQRVVLTSDDDGQLFGLTAPVNAAKRVTEVIGDKLVDRFELDECTGDLSLCFDNHATVQFITLSSGYEGWRLGHGDQQIICLGGGELSIFSP
jgi:hypothetical protein